MQLVLYEKFHALHMNPLVTRTDFRLLLISEHRSLRWLRKLPVVEAGHLSSDFHQHSLQTVITVPISQHRKLGSIDLPGRLGDEWEVHPRQELDVWWPVGVTLAAIDLQTVNAILVYGVSGTNNCPIPVAHHDIVSILEAIGTRAVSDPLLALLELLEKLEVSRY